MYDSKHSRAALVALTALAAVALVGCGTTPLAKCYSATGTLEVTQMAIKEAVTMPELEGTKAKSTLKQASQTGTDASKACLAAVKNGDADATEQYIGIINGVVQVGGNLAKDLLARELRDNISRQPAKHAVYDSDDDAHTFIMEADTGGRPGTARTLEARVASIVATNDVIAQADTTTTTLPSRGKAVGKATAPGQVKKSATNADSNAATGKAKGKTKEPDVTGTADVGP